MDESQTRDYQKGKGNLLLTIVCECGNLIRHPNRKRIVKCKKCNRKDDLVEMKKRDFEQTPNVWKRGI